MKFRAEHLSALIAFCLIATPVRAAVYRVGADGPYPTIKSLPALLPGDVVEIAPETYHEFARWTASGTAARPIVLRGLGTSGADMPTFDGAGLAVSGSGGTPRALFQIEGDHYIVEHLRFTHASNGQNGAGIRITGARDTTVRDCRIDHNEMGVMSDRNDGLSIECCDIGDNGNPEHFAGYAHNLYLAGRNTTIQFCDIHDAHAGLDLKCRGHYLTLLYNHIHGADEGELSLVDSDETSSPHSDVVAIGNWIESKPNRVGNTWKFIDFGQEGGHRIGTLFMIHNTLISHDKRLSYINLSSPTVEAALLGNAFIGEATLIRSGAERVIGSGNTVASGAAAAAAFTDASHDTPTFRSATGEARNGSPQFEFSPGMHQVAQAPRRKKPEIPGAFDSGNPPPTPYARTSSSNTTCCSRCAVTVTRASPASAPACTYASSFP